MAPETPETFTPLIPSKEMRERHARELEHPKGPPLVPPREKAEEDFEDTVEASRQRVIALEILNNIAIKVATAERMRPSVPQCRPAA